MADEFPNRIRFLREARGWTVRDLETRTGISFNMLHKLETGASGLTVDYMRRISRAFDMKASALLNDDDVEFRAEGDNAALIQVLNSVPLTDKPRVLTIAGELAAIVRRSADDLNAAAQRLTGRPDLLEELVKVWNPKDDEAKSGIVNLIRASGFDR